MNMVVTFVFGCCIGLVLGAGLILWAACMDRKRGGNDQPRSLGRNGSTVEGRGGIDMDDTIRRTDAIEAFNGAELGTYTDPDKAAQEIIGTVPSAEPKTDEENELKFYYVESIDDYWIGRRLDNFYYADWHEGLGFVWSKSRYLPWGEHIVDENTLWKEHTYPSEPIEIPFTEWIKGFVKKYFAEPKTGEWIDVNGDGSLWRCSRCEDTVCCNGNYCPSCGADMGGGKA